MVKVAQVKVASVKVEQTEGEEGRLVRGEFRTIDDACAALRRVQLQCGPRSYLKTDVIVTWEDGTSHGFRADVDQHGEDTNLTAVLRGWAERYKAGSAGPHLKAYLKPEQVKAWEEQARRILDGELEVL